MPIYEFYCPEHGKFEELRGMDERQNAPCPQCSDRAKLVLSVFSVRKFTRIDQADGAGFSTRYTPHDEIKERRRGYFLGQS